MFLLLVLAARSFALNVRKNITRLQLVACSFLVGISLTGCTGFPSSSFPSFGFGDSSNKSSSPDCSEIEKRMGRAHKRYAYALSKESPAIYLSFTGNLSRTMKRNRLRGIYEMTDLQLDGVIDNTLHACNSGRLTQADCQGANRLGDAYKPLVLAARDAHEHYCGNRKIN